MNERENNGEKTKKFRSLDLDRKLEAKCFREVPRVYSVLECCLLLQSEFFVRKRRIFKLEEPGKSVTCYVARLVSQARFALRR